MTIIRVPRVMCAPVPENARGHLAVVTTVSVAPGITVSLGGSNAVNNPPHRIPGGIHGVVAMTRTVRHAMTTTNVPMTIVMHPADASIRQSVAATMTHVPTIPVIHQRAVLIPKSIATTAIPIRWTTVYPTAKNACTSPIRMITRRHQVTGHLRTHAAMMTRCESMLREDSWRSTDVMDGIAL